MEGPGKKEVARLRVRVMGVGWGWCSFFYDLCQRALGWAGDPETLVLAVNLTGYTPLPGATYHAKLVCYEVRPQRTTIPCKLKVLALTIVLL